MAAGRVDHHLEAGAPDCVRGALEQFGAERLEVGNQDADDVRAVVAQALRDEAGLVPQIVDHRLDTGTGVRRHAATTVDDLGDRKSTRLNSSHLGISYAVFCLKK